MHGWNIISWKFPVDGMNGSNFRGKTVVPVHFETVGTYKPSVKYEHSPITFSHLEALANLETTPIKGSLMKGFSGISSIKRIGTTNMILENTWIKCRYCGHSMNKFRSYHDHNNSNWSEEKLRIYVYLYQSGELTTWLRTSRANISSSHFSSRMFCGPVYSPRVHVCPVHVPYRCRESACPLRPDSLWPISLTTDMDSPLVAPCPLRPLLASRLPPTNPSPFPPPFPRCPTFQMIINNYNNDDCRILLLVVLVYIVWRGCSNIRYRITPKGF